MSGLSTGEYHCRAILHSVNSVLNYYESFIFVQDKRIKLILSCFTIPSHWIFTAVPRFVLRAGLAGSNFLATGGVLYNLC